MRRCRFLVIGGGMAGASAAAELAAQGPVLLLEREARPGQHSTGRSAAMFTEVYGPPAVRRLTAAGRAFLANPPPGFAEHPLLHPRGSLVIGRDDQRALLDEAFGDQRDFVASIRFLGPDETARLVPVLRRDGLAGAVFEPEAMDIDVAALHLGFLRLLKARGGAVLTDCAPTAAERRPDGWLCETPEGPIQADVVVNAAGAWADEVAALAGARPVGLVPKRRTAVVIEPATPIDGRAWPMVNDVSNLYYFKPESGGFLCSPVDETPSPPCDAQPDELDIAIAIDRVEQATTLVARRVTSRWAGLRSFVADGVPVAGWDDAVEGFFWLCGQGGYGIQTSPALGRLAAALASGGGTVPPDLADRGILAETLSPARLRS